MQPRSTLRPALCAGVVCLATTKTGAADAATVSMKRLNIEVGARATVAGTAEPGRIASLQIARRGRWVSLDRDRVGAGGRYVLRHRARRSLSARARVHVSGAGSRSVGRLNVFRRALASWYGPGFYGRRTGCGRTLVAGRLGVANKTLPCGTRVTLRHRGRVIRVPVIDRGPYVGAREFDLTAATARRLRFRGHGPILVATG